MQSNSSSNFNPIQEIVKLINFKMERHGLEKATQNCKNKSRNRLDTKFSRLVEFSKTCCSMLRAVFKDLVERIKGRKKKSSHSQPFKCYSLPKIDVFASFSPTQRQMPFLTVKTADLGLENRKYSETRRKVGLENRGSKWPPDHGKGPRGP